jgi:hypothetical protein
MHPMRVWGQIFVVAFLLFSKICLAGGEGLHGRVSWSQLPPEIIEQVLSHLGRKDLSLAMLVSKQMYGIAGDHPLWRDSAFEIYVAEMGQLSPEMQDHLKEQLNCDGPIQRSDLKAEFQDLYESRKEAQWLWKHLYELILQLAQSDINYSEKYEMPIPNYWRCIRSSAIQGASTILRTTGTTGIMAAVLVFAGSAVAYGDLLAFATTDQWLSNALIFSCASLPVLKRNAIHQLADRLESWEEEKARREDENNLMSYREEIFRKFQEKFGQIPPLTGFVYYCPKLESN